MERVTKVDTTQRTAAEIEQLALAYSRAKAENDRTGKPLEKAYKAAKASLQEVLYLPGTYNYGCAEIHVKHTTSLRVDREALVAMVGEDVVAKCEKPVTSVVIDVFVDPAKAFPATPVAAPTDAASPKRTRKKLAE